MENGYYWVKESCDLQKWVIKLYEDGWWSNFGNDEDYRDFPGRYFEIDPIPIKRNE